MVVCGAVASLHGKCLAAHSSPHRIAVAAAPFFGFGAVRHVLSCHRSLRRFRRKLLMSAVRSSLDRYGRSGAGLAR